MMNFNKSGLKIAREKANLDSLELASLLKIEKSVLDGWEAGGGTITLDNLLKLMSILNTSAEMILFNESRSGLNVEQLDIVLKLYLMMKNNKWGWLYGYCR